MDQVKKSETVSELNDKQLGNLGEDLASRFLQQLTYEIVERNWTCRFGEADIIAMDGDEYVFCEVKTRRVSGDVSLIFPEEAINEKKRERYIHMARVWQREKGAERIRFDVIAINIVSEHMARLKHIQHAFEMDE